HGLRRRLRGLVLLALRAELANELGVRVAQQYAAQRAHGDRLVAQVDETEQLVAVAGIGGARRKAEAAGGDAGGNREHARRAVRVVGEQRGAGIAVQVEAASEQRIDLAGDLAGDVRDVLAQRHEDVRLRVLEAAELTTKVGGSDDE